MSLADFTLTIHSDPPREVRVIVYRTTTALRRAATRYDNSARFRRYKRRGRFRDTLGVCHRFELRDGDGELEPLCAIVRLAKPHLGVGVVTHELAHAAVWIQELNASGRLTTDNDEEFCWNLGELTRQAINAMTDRGVYT